MADTTSIDPSTQALMDAEFERNKEPLRPSRVVLYVFLTLTALVWLVPIAGAVFASFRPFSETVRGTLDWWESVDLERKEKPMRSGISREFEAELLSKWHEQNG